MCVYLHAMFQINSVPQTDVYILTIYCISVRLATSNGWWKVKKRYRIFARWKVSERYVTSAVTPSRLITQKMWSLLSFERSVTIYIRQGAKTLFRVGVKLGLSHREKVIGWGCSSIGCWGRYQVYILGVKAAGAYLIKYACCNLLCYQWQFLCFDDSQRARYLTQLPPPPTSSPGKMAQLATLVISSPDNGYT